MIVCIAKEQQRRPNWEELEQTIKRNFSGLLEEDFNPVRILMDYIGFPEEYFQVKTLFSLLSWIRTSWLKTGFSSLIWHQSSIC